jgi:ABC-type branched-subunit amino acid transport system ATPase component
LISLFLRRRSLRAEKTNLENARRWLRFVTLADKENALAENLSYGQQKLLSIARLLTGEYDVFLLDEPTAGVDSAMAKTILDVIKKVVQEGKTAVVIEHNMRIIADISDIVYYMCVGKATFSGTPEEVLKNQRVRDEYIGI